MRLWRKLKDTFIPIQRPVFIVYPLYFHPTNARIKLQVNYSGCSNYDHSKHAYVGVLVTNLGTPDAPTPSALRRYLKEFLSDPRVVEVNRLLWWFILKVILLIRPTRSAHAYATVWTEQGSPLAVNTRKQAEALQTRLGDKVLVDWAMRYGQPSIKQKVDALLNQGVRKLLILPLYPQYSASTTASTFDALATDFVKRRWLPGLRFVDSYHDHPAYITALCASVEEHWQQHGRPDKLVFSYHGIPLRYLHAGDPYHCHCHKTTRLVAEKLGLAEDSYQTTFQSRFGREEWLKPYTDETLMNLPATGTKSVQVICPGFAADCLETLEEIAIQNRDFFLQAGGETFSYIPALNSREKHIACLAEIIEQHLKGWSIEEDSVAASRQTSELAKKHPYNL